MPLNKKTLFITGASRGIGLSIALKAARDGANIAIAAQTAEPHPKLPGTIYTAAREIEAASGTRPNFVKGACKIAPRAMTSVISWPIHRGMKPHRLSVFCMPCWPLENP